MPVPTPARMLTRRQAIAGVSALVGAGAGAVQWGSGPLSARQFDSTPPAPPEVNFTSPPDPIAALAAELDYDPDAIFAFVRDEIHYETYAGVLRGAKGTLWARAGNSADQAVLLEALLSASQIPHRFAFGPLPPEANASLSDATSTSTARTAFAAALDASTPVLEAPATPTPNEQDAVALTLQQAEVMRASAASQIGPRSQLLASLLDDAGVTLPDLSGKINAFDATNHAWIQVADGPAWIDLDPTLPAGMELATPAFTAEAPGADMIHSVAVRIVVEELAAGMPSPREVLAWETEARNLVNTPVALAMMGPDDISDLGISISSLFSGAVIYAPSLLAGTDANAATSTFAMGVTGSDGVANALDVDESASIDGETTAVWLQVEIHGPDAAPIVVQRTLIDRIGPLVRASGVVTPADIAPLVTVQDINGKTTIPELGGITLLSCDVSRLPTIHAIRDTWSTEIFGSLYQYGPSFASFRNALSFEHGLPAGFDLYPTQPGLTAFTVRSELAESGEQVVTLTADLLYQSAHLTPVTDVAAPSESPHVVASVINQVAEQVLVDSTLRAFSDGPTDLTLPSVGSIFDAAVATDVAFATIASIDQLALIDASEATLVRLQSLLDLGLILIAPLAPVTVDEQTAYGWWVVDPVSGRMWDEADNGMGFAGGKLRLYAPLGEWRSLADNVRRWAGPYAILGKCLAYVISQAVMVSDFSNSSGGPDAFIEAFKNLDPQATKDCLG